MKKVLALVLTAALLAAALTGCGKKEEGSDLGYIKEKGTLVIGITEYEPMDYKDENGEWIGFDADFARLICEKLGVEPEFVVLADWGQKFFELNAKNIDAIWNGMTINEEALNNTSCTDPYAINAQVVVMQKDVVDQYPDSESIKGLQFACERGSAGEALLAENGVENVVALQDQAAALMEVAAGTAQACLIDVTMANAMTGEGTGYPDLAVGISLSKEEYGVGFRKDSDVTAVFNEYLEQLVSDGSMAALSEKYGITLADKK